MGKNAIFKENTEIVKILVENGADVDAKGTNRKGMIEYAIWKDNAEIINILKRAKEEKRKTTVDGFVNKIFGGKGR